MNERKSWDDYFFDIAQLVATRATCPRKSVGCVIVSNNRILSTGYNGARSGEPHCTEIGCDLSSTRNGKSCTRAVHAEINALRQFYPRSANDPIYFINNNGADLTMYCTLQPCPKCQKEISLYLPNMTIKWLEDYPYKGKDDAEVQD